MHHVRRAHADGAKKSDDRAPRHLDRMPPPAHALELLRRHNQEALLIDVCEENEFLAIVAAPARRDGDAILIVDGVTEIAGVESLGLRIRFPYASGEPGHFNPLSPTFNHLPCHRSIKNNRCLRHFFSAANMTPSMRSFRSIALLLCAMLTCIAAAAQPVPSPDAVACHRFAQRRRLSHDLSI